MKITQIAKIFPPSNSKLDIDVKFFRVGKWTTNGSWIIKTAYEPKTLANLKDKPTTLTEETVDKVIESAISGELKQVYLDEKHIELTEELPVACLNGDNNYLHIYVNVYYLMFFTKLGIKGDFYFYGSDPKKMVVVKSGDVLVGAIAPIDMKKEKQ